MNLQKVNKILSQLTIRWLHARKEYGFQMSQLNFKKVIQRNKS